MNIFELKIFDDQGEQCSFYTVQWDGEELSETEKFFSKFKRDEKLRRPLQELAKFIEIIIGRENGALKDYFRFEKDAHALPPTGNYRIDEVTINYRNFPLRLYCLRINRSLVVLFNGGEKTSENAQGGNTSMTFAEANQFTKKIIDALNQKQIYVTPNQREFRNFDGSDEIIL